VAEEVLDVVHVGAGEEEFGGAGANIVGNPLRAIP